MTETHLAAFRGKEIRKVIHNNEWWFSIVDVCGALTESADAGAYWRKLKQRLKEEGSEVVTFCHGLCRHPFHCTPFEVQSLPEWRQHLEEH